ncbi:flagellar hook-associated protein FlgL [Jatrophihabitans telluris]|uniref:Flagellar hook-associated protein FlgL n=1 Tax=Jatrophihabitans telluris TaxID=2038343 RepID=A0ABY4QXK2_9ACTN|nr:flagellar hook-associated protein FlgL [Jatrophihabitans telluris]UQX87937.1 flagellar hook-associated protein FlgL [Jatrophihabitans telluris]
MRVTEGSAAYGALVGLQSTASKLADLQSQLSSGRQITKPSDDPSGTATALTLRAELKRNDQYQTGASDALGWLTTVDSNLSSAVTQLQTVRNLVLQGKNTGTNDSTAYEALAQQVDQIRTSTLSLANAAYLGRPVFGGTTSGAVAFDSSGSYVGDTAAVSRTVGPNTTVQINQTGTSVFGANGSNLFDTLSTISNDLRTNPSNLTADLNSLDSAMKTISAAQGAAGAVYSRIQSTQTVNSTNVIQLKSQLSDVQDIDLADMAIKVSSADASYQAALATTAKVRQISLLDFLK